MRILGVYLFYIAWYLYEDKSNVGWHLYRPYRPRSQYQRWRVHPIRVWKGSFLSTAANCKIALVFPDTSPRGAGIEGEDADWDFGTGAGFYLDATLAKWSKHYNMFSFLTQELPQILSQTGLPLVSDLMLSWAGTLHVSNTAFHRFDIKLYRTWLVNPSLAILWEDMAHWHCTFLPLHHLLRYTVRHRHSHLLLIQRNARGARRPFPDTSKAALKRGISGMRLFSWEKCKDSSWTY